MTRQIKEAALCGLLVCALLLAGAGVASDKDGRVLSSQEHSKALITSPRIPSQTSPPPRP